MGVVMDDSMEILGYVTFGALIVAAAAAATVVVRKIPGIGRYLQMGRLWNGRSPNSVCTDYPTAHAMGGQPTSRCPPYDPPGECRRGVRAPEGIAPAILPRAGAQGGGIRGDVRGSSCRSSRRPERPRGP